MAGSLACLFGLTVATASGGPLTAPRLPHLAAVRAAAGPVRIVAFGSSSTQGIGASSPAGAYPARLAAILSASMPWAAKVEVINRGIGGEDVDDMVRRLQSDILAKRPDLVIWQTGSNDPMRHVPIDRFEAETRAGIAAMRAAGVDVMLMEPQWCPKLEQTEGAALFRHSVRKLGQELGVPVIRRADMMRRWLAEGTLTPRQLVAPDGLHMTDGSYALLAQDVALEILADSAPLPLAAAGPSRRRKDEKATRDALPTP